MREPTRQDWDSLPMSREARVALNTFMEMLLNHTSNGESIHQARRTFSAIRRRDMQSYLSAHAPASAEE